MKFIHYWTTNKLITYLVTQNTKPGLAYWVLNWFNSDVGQINLMIPELSANHIGVVTPSPVLRKVVKLMYFSLVRLASVDDWTTISLSSLYCYWWMNFTHLITCYASWKVQWRWVKFIHIEVYLTAYVLTLDLAVAYRCPCVLSVFPFIPSRIDGPKNTRSIISMVRSR